MNLQLRWVVLAAGTRCCISGSQSHAGSADARDEAQQRPSVHVASVALSALRCCQRANSGGRAEAAACTARAYTQWFLQLFPPVCWELTCGSQKGRRRDAEAEAHAQ